MVGNKKVCFAYINVKSVSKENAGSDWRTAGILGHMLIILRNTITYNNIVKRTEGIYLYFKKIYFDFIFAYQKINLSIFSNFSNH